jgi:CRP/FNR family transcriptional regulator
MPAVATLQLKPKAKTYFMSQPEARKAEVTCSSCNLREVCLPGGLCVEDLERMQNVVYVRRRVKRGETLFNAGDEFKAIYAVRSGFFKTSLSDGEGREQVTGFSMGGELLGLEAIGAGRHGGNAVALVALIEAAAHDVPALQRHLHAVLSREIVRDHGVMMLLGSMRAEQRLAVFLTNLSKRLVRRGYSACDFHLRMTREDIGSYLGLKLETVSRLFSQFQKDGLIEVAQKHVRILDIAGVERLLAVR